MPAVWEFRGSVQGTECLALMLGMAEPPQGSDKDCDLIGKQVEPFLEWWGGSSCHSPTPIRYLERLYLPPCLQFKE